MIGRIYRIIHLESNICYVGSTMDELRFRWQRHKTGYQGWLNDKQYEVAIYPYFRKFGVENFKMILIKEYEVCDRKHLAAYEQLWVSKLKSINKNSPFKIGKLSDKAYYRVNKDKFKVYYEANRDKISERRNAKSDCGCGGKFTTTNKVQHLKTARHQKYIELKK